MQVALKQLIILLDMKKNFSTSSIDKNKAFLINQPKLSKMENLNNIPKKHLGHSKRGKKTNVTITQRKNAYRAVSAS
jgi:hypothetical protein